MDAVFDPSSKAMRVLGVNGAPPLCDKVLLQDKKVANPCASIIPLQKKSLRPGLV